MPLAKCIAFLGTGSDVGKSIVVAAVCRLLRNRGIDVAPYKAQNMSNNSYVTREGGEMGRAQIVQAEASGRTPHVDMNPVLLKPSSDVGAQIVVQGKVVGNALASDYFRNTDALFAKARESLQRLRERAEVVVIEGAGSCAEVNLRDRDFVNFETAHACDAPVILVGDIDRGGIFAQIVGTLEVIPPRDRARVAGFVVNKFRGDARLFDDGIRYLERRTGLPVLGLVPYFRHIEIDSEDGMPLDTVIDPPDRPQPDRISLAAIRLPHISNFTDFAPLQREDAVRFHYLAKPRDLTRYDAVFLPGSKNVRFDLGWLREAGWEKPLRDAAAAGRTLVGVCGGYQMLGRTVRDPRGLEGEPGETAGLGLLDCETELAADKVLARAAGEWIADATPVDGYEIHMGRTLLGTAAFPVARLHTRNAEPTDEPDGARNAAGTVWGTYLHGIFDRPEFRNRFLRQLDPAFRGTDPRAAAQFKEEQYDLLAEHFARHLDIPRLLRIAGLA